ncbi:molybdenum cofactor biosynthesis F family protein [Sporosarcina sp. ACRSM]|uniref:molybdenum cofactor biosynthesis F family protein n=1 Tax=Sporosarcina sp. ACRSM TaxID=2918216 RepID=UPI001EF74699|nr:molybdenum cofactor biosynthesis F family protein [Sporosarcina sp. ACRSM]MCG7333678.1 molybdenum cofactor biosynthesis F family protein [Sporosarcina sp. ACRSM]
MTLTYNINNHVETQTYVPVEEWPTLEEMADGFSENRIPHTSALAGKTIVLNFEGGSVISHEFKDEKTLVWTILEGEERGLSGTDNYQAFEVRQGIFFVTFYKPAYNEQVSLIWRSEDGNVFVAASNFVEINGERRTKTDFTSAVIEGLPGNKPIVQTSDLVGKRVLYRYSSDDWYEHVYFTKETMAWHCVNGAETGLADVEKCAFFNLDEDLTILFWTETIMPVEAIIVVDLKELRSTGRFFCWDPKPQRVISLTFGSLAAILNDTTYPEK